MSTKLSEVEKLEMIRDLAMITTEAIRRMGADYGSSEDWRYAITKTVGIMEKCNKAITEAA